MTIFFPALLGVTAASVIVGCFAALYVIELRQQRRTLQILRNQTEPALSTSEFLKRAADQFRGDVRVCGSGNWMGQWYEDDKRTESGACPACGTKIGNRAGGDRRGRDTKGVDSESGAGVEYDEGPVGVSDTRWFHYIPRAYQKDWEALGWKITEIGAPHDSYSILGEWVGEGPPTKPH